MECKNHQWLIKSPIYVNFKKHYCPTCKIALGVVRVSTLTEFGSHEAKVLGVSTQIGMFQSGRVKVHWKEFECPQCKQRITIERMREIEACPRW